MSYEGPERRRSLGWHLEKNVSVGHIITTVLAVISALLWLTDLDKRLTVIENLAGQQREIDKQQDSRVDGALAILRADIKEMNGKLDRLIERSK